MCTIPLRIIRALKHLFIECYRKIDLKVISHFDLCFVLFRMNKLILIQTQLFTIFLALFPDELKFHVLTILRIQMKEKREHKISFHITSDVMELNALISFIVSQRNRHYFKRIPLSLNSLPFCTFFFI